MWGTYIACQTFSTPKFRLFQGEILSPILFSLFIYDIESSLQGSTMGNTTLEQITIYLLMFADDAMLISNSKDGLQNLLVQFEIYYNNNK